MPSTLCRIVLTVVTCVVDPSTPPATPQDAVAILTASLGPGYAPVPVPPFEPGWWVDAPLNIPPTDRDWPFTGSFAPTWFPTDRWLDGTPRVDPLLYGNPWLFGGTPFGPGLFGGTVPGGRSGARANRPNERAPAASPRVPDRAPRPAARAPLAAPGGSVRTQVGRD
jgi:hypothetical protein